MVTESLVSVAVYVVDSATVSVTVSVTTPFASDGPLAAEMIDEPPLFASVTVLPLTGLLLEFLSVTVMVDDVLPSAVTDAGLAATVGRFGLTGTVTVKTFRVMVWVASFVNVSFHWPALPKANALHAVLVS